MSVAKQPGLEWKESTVNYVFIFGLHCHQNRSDMLYVEYNIVPSMMTSAFRMAKEICLVKTIECNIFIVFTQVENMSHDEYIYTYIYSICSPKSKILIFALVEMQSFGMLDFFFFSYQLCQICQWNQNANLQSIQIND